MLKNTFKQHITSSSQTEKAEPLSGFTLAPLTRSIRELMTLAGLTFASSNAWADIHINPNEIWLYPGYISSICAQDIDQDGDQDIFKVYEGVVTLLENTGTPEVPEFAQPIALISNPSSFKLNRLGLTDCLYDDNTPRSVDIDADGDLDLFISSYTKELGLQLVYARNDGSKDYPVYVNEPPLETFGLPINVGSSIMFKDIDQDGDQDFFSTSLTGFYENIGTAENARFIERSESALMPLCDSRRGLIIDLNNDGQWDRLCRNYEDESFDYIESSISGYLPKRTLFNAGGYRNFGQTQTFDIDQDDDLDIISVDSVADDGLVLLYTNTGSSLLPEFGAEQIVPSTLGLYSSANQLFSDLDNDGDLDYLDVVATRIGYAHNIGSNLNPTYEISTLSSELHQCNDSFFEIAQSSLPNLSTFTDFNITNINLVDIDGDNDLDLFSRLYLRNSEIDIGVYCENQGTPNSPFFTTGIITPLSFYTEGPRLFPQNIFFGDIDGDHDQDAWANSLFYENIGTPTNPSFDQSSHSHIPFSLTPQPSILLDLDRDGRIDSTINGLYGELRLLNRNLEPATAIANTILGTKFVLATNRPSQVQLHLCNFSDNICEKTIVLPETAQELSLSNGDFNNDGKKEIVLAMVDPDEHLKIEIYDAELHLIGTAAGDTAHSVSVSAGQLDNDPADEYVVSFVQADGRVAAITYNFDSSQVSHLVANQGSSPSVTVGQFDGTNNGYALAYLTPDGRLESGTLRGDATLISLGETTSIGTVLAGQIVINAANILPSSPGDEYLTSLIQEDGTAALIGFTADGERLGKIVGNASQQPTVASGHFPGANDTGLAVSLIQPDGKPAIVFLDNQANYIATGVGSTNASVSTLAVYDIDGDGIDEGILIYIDQTGIPRWEVFGFDGVKK